MILLTQSCNEQDGKTEVTVKRCKDALTPGLDGLKVKVRGRGGQVSLFMIISLLKDGLKMTG